MGKTIFGIGEKGIGPVENTRNPQKHEVRHYLYDNEGEYDSLHIIIFNYFCLFINLNANKYIFINTLYVN